MTGSGGRGGLVTDSRPEASPSGHMSARWLVGFGLAAVVAAGAASCVPTPPGRGTPGSEAPPAGPSDATVASDAPGGPSSGAEPTVTPSFSRPTPNPSPTFLIHEVTAGETLTSIARLHGTTARSIAYWNRARYPSLDPDSSTYEPNRIEVGWILQLIPTEVVDEDELPDPTASPDAGSASPVATTGPS
jgi:hypothetical protein